MVSNNLLSMLVDFFLGNDSPLKASSEKRSNMGNQYSKPAFDGLISTVCYIARSSETSITKKESEVKPGTCLNEDDLHPYEKEIEKLLLHPKFLDKAILEGFEAMQVGKLISYLSYENMKISKLMALAILRGINKYDYEEVKPFLTVLV